MRIEVPDLWHPRFRDALPLDYDARPVAGWMAPFVGRRYTEEEVWQYRRSYADVHKSEEEYLRPLAERIRAFDVPVLAQAELMVSRLAELPPAVYDMLSVRLPGWQWDAQQKDWQREHMTGPVKKYGILHTTLRAPIDETTHQPMVLELFGRISALNEQPVGINWFGSRQDDRAAEDAIFLGELRLRLQRATYANTASPGIGVPLYL
jgi:hypothetical protein